MVNDRSSAQDRIEFISNLKLVDDFYGKPFVLMDWQTELITNVYGTLKDDGYRQYRFAYLEMPKKNSKTTLIAALGLSHLTLDPEDGQIYCCAADRAQASLVYKAAVTMIDQDAFLSRLLNVTDSRKEIKNIKTGTVLKVMSSEAYTKHGVNPTVVIFDELHAQPNRELYDFMTFGSGSSRKEPLYWIITTAGDDPDRKSIGWEKHEYAKKILDGEITDPYWYVKIYAAPEDADIFDEKTWYAANPSLGVTIDVEAVRQEAILARNSESGEKLFRWLRLNQWVSLKSTGWLPLTLFDRTVGDWGRSDLTGKRCYIGLDLSSTGDLTAAAYIFPPQEGVSTWRVIYDAWIPEDHMRDRIKRDGVPFDIWVNNKKLIATPGNAVDYGYIEAQILAACHIYDVQAICPDPWNSHMLTQRLEKAGQTIIEVPQNMSNLSPAMKEIERLMKIGHYEHEKHPVARWCFGNVATCVDGNENVKPMKNKSKDRIDLTVAEITGMSVAMRMTKVRVYEVRGMRSLL